ncbi:hypothetical protein AB0F17_51025 [Nonomuraea sp. NPDC026600]|uniref:hypothetical protein n=1 Tax=Nonomuraea sp. NPDC026600 TaxID=3155363 RepID=UPI0033C87FA0
MDGKIKPDALMNLGRVDRLDVNGLLGLAASIRKHFGGDPDRPGEADAAIEGLGASVQALGPVSK